MTMDHGPWTMTTAMTTDPNHNCDRLQRRIQKKKKKKDRGRSKTPPPGKRPATGPSDTAQVVKLLSQIECKHAVIIQR